MQPDYPNLAAAWTTARAAAAPVLYRVPAAPGDPALWWAAADGSNPHPIPNTDANSQIHALSPDGHWAIYSLYIEESGDRHRRIPYLLDLRTGKASLLICPSTAGPAWSARSSAPTAVASGGR